MNLIKPKFNLDGRVAVVTGASKGIGKSIARGLAEFGAKVVVSSRKQEAVDVVAGSFTADGLDAVGFACHVARDEQRQALIAFTLEKYGRIDILVNNAGTNPYFGPIDQMGTEVYQKTMDINLNAAMALSNMVYPIMKKNGGGSIIHISSIEGVHPSAFFAAYNISKASLIMLGQNQAVEWGKDNIRVNVICPGLVKTKLSSALFANQELLDRMESKIPLGRAGNPDEMAGLAVFLASEASSYMNGAVIINDGGLVHAPIY